MDLAFTEEEKAFQREVRDWITANMPPEVAEESRRSRSSHVSKERLLQWQRKLAERGWLCPNWPQEYGGAGRDPARKNIFERGVARPRFAQFSSLSHKMGGAGPVEIWEQAPKETIPSHKSCRRGVQGLDLRQVSARVRARRAGFRAAPAQGVPPFADPVEDANGRRPAAFIRSGVA